MNSLKYPQLLIFLLLVLCSISSLPVSAHQQPTTLVVLDVSPNKVAMNLHVPLSELELAFGHDVTRSPETSLETWQVQFKEYLLAHIQVTTAKDQRWSVEVGEMKVEKAEQTQSGSFQEVTVHLTLTPPAGVSTRKFILNYDLIMHQVVSHKALVSIRSDWESGQTEAAQGEVGVIKVNTETTKIDPFEINLEKGSWWSGFKGMIGLGMQHIKEGTDHLLFLLMVLLPAPLLANGGKWGAFGGSKYSVARLLKIVTAFTLGHSITLLAGAAGWLRLPQQPVEILVAFSILISAVHAIRPLFSGKEMYVAAGFGLVHGLAFATVLSNLNLGAGALALSILGFNLGIELMQLFVIAITVPWLILLSLTPVYKQVRIILAILAALAALGWITERVSSTPNVIGSSIQQITPYAPLGILLLAVLAIPAYLYSSVKERTISSSPER